MHNGTHNQPTRRRTRHVQRNAFLHPKVLLQIPLREKVRRQLNTRSETGTDHGGGGSAVPALYALGFVDLSEPVDGALVLMLRADGEEGGVGL